MSTALTRLSWRSLTHEQLTACFSETHRCVFRRVAVHSPMKWRHRLFEWFFMPVVRKLFTRFELLRVVKRNSNFDYTSFLVDIRTLVMINKVLCFSGISIFFDISRLLEWWYGGIWIRYTVVGKNSFILFFFISFKLYVCKFHRVCYVL